MKVLIFTNLFPNSLDPNNGLFNMYQFIHLSSKCEIRVVSPIPWYRVFKHKECLSANITPGIKVYYPIYLYIPKIARSLHGFQMFLSVFGHIIKLRKDFNFDIIYATWAYPDGFAIALLSKIIQKPFIIKVHGTDINEYTKYLLRRFLIIYTLKMSKKIICVSNALKYKIASLGIKTSKIITIPNGIDTSKFTYMDPVKARLRLSLPTDIRIIMFIGNLSPVKGLDYLLEAFLKVTLQYQTSLLLVIVGNGELRESLKSKAQKLGLIDNNSIYFAGEKKHDEIPLWINACDILCLPSLSEGLPNVIIESFACGRPVVATKVGGIPEVVKEGVNGILVDPADSNILANALNKALNTNWDRKLIQESVNDRSWYDNAEKVHSLLLGSM